MATSDLTSKSQSAQQMDATETTKTDPVDQSSKKAESLAAKNNVAEAPSVNMEFVLDIPLEVTVELGRTKLLINDLLKLGQGSVIELAKLAGESLEILANQKPIARGEVVVVNEKYGVRLTEVISPSERIERLR
jgi:flagellar motor switch protein FliN/FliY